MEKRKQILSANNAHVIESLNVYAYAGLMNGIVRKLNGK